MSYSVERKPWRRDLPFRVLDGSVWKERGTNWKVTSRYHFEAGNDRPPRAVRIHCFEGEHPGVVLHMSEDRFLCRFVPKDAAR